MTRNDFIDVLRADMRLGMGGFKGYRLTTGEPVMVLDGVTSTDRDLIIEHARTYGLTAEAIGGAEWFGNRPNVRVGVKGFGE